MTKFEFLEASGLKGIPDSEYDIIETVYTFHPSIDAVKGKKQIAELFLLGGIRLIRDMVPTAMKARELEDQIMSTRNRLEQLQASMKALKNGEDSYQSDQG